jgi:hypothetical protein
MIHWFINPVIKLRYQFTYAIKAFIAGMSVAMMLAGAATLIIRILYAGAITDILKWISSNTEFMAMTNGILCSIFSIASKNIKKSPLSLTRQNKNHRQSNGSTQCGTLTTEKDKK